MLFNSFDFIVLVSVTFILYYLPLLRSYQVIILIASSFIFYAYNQPYLLTLLLFSAFINAVTSYITEYSQHKRLTASVGIIANLIILCSFKYSKLLFYTFFNFDATPSTLSNFIISIPLPIGISFFTFQGISLVVDVFRQQDSERFNDMNIDKNFLLHMKKTFFFICFFPQLVAGPIVKAHQFLPQIKNKYFNQIDWQHVFKSLVLGYFLKMVVADNLKDQTFWIAYPWFEGLSSATLITLLFAYSIQIFADFAGYSLIAIGIASLFCYRLPINFNFPYISQSFSEFWRRWHISLSTWLRDYLYFPLGGNRLGSFNTYRNLFLVMFLGGLWHGAAWSYAAWGTWHGIALTIERRFRSDKQKESTILSQMCKIMFVFTFVTISWVFFKLNNFPHVIAFISSIAGNTEIHESWLKIGMSIIYSLPIIGYHLIYLVKKKKRAWPKQYFQTIIYSLMLFFIVLNSGDPGEFIYFQF